MSKVIVAQAPWAPPVRNVMACREVATKCLIDIKEGLSEGKMRDMCHQSSTLMDFDTSS